MSWSQISADQVQPQPWKNGGGTTRELLAWPHAHDWALRISVARIERDGPFSSFPGVQRWLAVLEGAGLHLFDWPQAVGDEPLHFDGTLAPDAELLHRPCTVLNLMQRRGRLRLLPADQVLLPDTPWVGLFTAQGGLLEHGHRAMPLAPHTLAWCEAPARQSCLFTAPDDRQAWWLTWSEDA